MKITCYIFLFLFLNSCLSKNVNHYDLIISNVGLIDGTGSPVQNNKWVYIKDGKIEIISERQIENAVALNTINGAGKFLMPGLIEAHAHPASIDVDPVKRKDYPNSYRTMIHYGVTSTILFGGSRASYATMKEMQSATANNIIMGPRIYYSSPLVTIEGRHPMKTYPSPNWVDGKTVILIEDDEEKIRSMVNEAKANHAIGIKLVVEDGPTPPFMKPIDESLVRKIVQQAHLAGLPVFAHVSDMDELKTCVRSGVDHIVHFLGIRINWEKDKEIIEEMQKRNMSWITTLALGKSLVYYRLNPQWLEKPEIRMVYDQKDIEGRKYEGMETQGRMTLKAMAGNDTISLNNLVKPLVNDIARAMEAGINVVLGSDVGGDNFVFAGLSLHEEMEMMQMGGIPTLQIIKMATLNGAKMLGIEKEFGSIEKGKFADLILLNKNPADDIRNTLSIEKIFKGGIEQKRIVSSGRSK